jgi:hypothetical protein
MVAGPGAEPSDCSRARVGVSTKTLPGLRSGSSGKVFRGVGGLPSRAISRPVGLPTTGQKKLMKLWKLWKTQDSCAPSLWITLLGGLLPEGGSARIGDVPGGGSTDSPHLENTLSDG